MSLDIFKSKSANLARLVTMMAFFAAVTSCKTPMEEELSVENSVRSFRSGVWLTNVGSKVLYSKKSIDQAVARSSQFGINSIYPVVWNKEEVFLQSETVKKHLGAEFIASPENMDVLLEVVKSSLSKGMSTYAWYENGLKVPVKWESGDFFRLGKVFKDKGWLTSTQSGQYFTKCEFGVCKGFLNPNHDEVRSFLVEFVEEIAENYGVEGVMIDDHFSMDPSFGYDKISLAKYYTFIKEKNISDSDDSFNRFRSESIVSLINDMKRAVNAHGKRLILSPGGEPDWAKRAWLQDWERVVWTKAVDEIILQAYRYDMWSYMAMIHNRKIRNLSRYVPFGVAVLFGLKNNTKTTGELVYKQTKAAFDAGYDVSYFYYDTIDTIASGKENATQRSSWHDRTKLLLHSVR